VQVPARSTINKEGITMKNKSLYLIILLAGVVLFELFTAGSWNKVQIPYPISTREVSCGKL